MDLQLAGKRVLVTGASKGIGLATVQAFVAEGAVVVGASRSRTRSPARSSCSARRPCRAWSART
ncbi:SDR family NAD(P)-dependent oxidoreductase [Actinoplanes sp. NPDC051470]|uniref:SDR family NAD(P)-dependent oxidoreductase n=1 Tax=Actinoplanes sp. NPDC051470 TaxID=3157224 RepID=UPI00344AF315